MNALYAAKTPRKAHKLKFKEQNEVMYHTPINEKVGELYQLGKAAR
jgi:hypothetical protein